MDCYEKLVNNLRSLRNSINKTQVEVSLETGIRRSNISRYETGIMVPPLDIILRLADYYDVSVDELLREEF